MTIREMMSFVEKAPEGGCTARGFGMSIFADADDPPGVHEQVRDAIRCHFDADEIARVIRLHFVREGVLTV